MKKTDKIAAFSLVELAIVLVVTGLLVGSVMEGMTLVRSSGLKNLMNQISEYNMAFNSFKDRYFNLPGDMPNATSFWGKDNVSCPGDSGNASTPGTCNGNASQEIGDSNDESFRVWQHLSLAGLITGSFPGTGNGWDVQVGVDIPATKFNTVGFSFFSSPSLTAGDGNYYPANGNTIISLGGKVPGDLTEAAFLSPVDAFYIDNKIDDGKPGKGLIKSWRPTAAPETQNADCATDADETAAAYKLSVSTIACSFNLEKFGSY